MKRLLLIGLLLLCHISMRAQTDSVAVPQWEDTAYSEEEYQAPNIHPIYYFGSPFCEHFAEMKLFLGFDDLGLGFNYTYLPEVWGGHLTGYTLNTLWVMGGPDYRLSKPWDNTDWHLYGSLGFCYDGDYDLLHPAMEVGLRIASPTGSGTFCINSVTFGAMTNFESFYVTMGLSISLCTLFSLLLIL